MALGRTGEEEDHFKVIRTNGVLEGTCASRKREGVGFEGVWAPVRLVAVLLLLEIPRPIMVEHRAD